MSDEERPQTYLVKADDPILRDREVERLVSDLLEGEDRLLALEDLTIPGRARATGDEGAGGDADEVVETPVMRAVFNALQSPPFMTGRRIVVVRDVGNVVSQYASTLAEHVKDPVGGVYLVLVSGGGRIPAAIDKAVKAAGVPTVGPASESTADVLAAALRAAKLKLTGPTSARVVEHLGGDAGRVPELVELLHSTYGDRATLDLADVEPYLGEVGTVAWWDLANSIDRGDVPGALEVLHRLLRATSAKQPKLVHPLQVMATLVSHYQRLLRLDDPAIATKEQAAAAVGGSPGAARHRLDASRRLGTAGLREAFDLLSAADLDLRGRTGAPEETVLEVLVARLAALSRRHAPAARSRR
ncbi:MAG: hypothetical protein M5T61_00335 [Acidimicrobiia bacterium]|nr:hypothetical protein [Acidimicrobiia bacterium]